MDWLGIILSLLVGFWVGSRYGKTYYKKRKAYLVKLLLLPPAIVLSAWALFWLVGLLSPSSFLKIVSILPTFLQIDIFTDLWMRGGSTLWVILISGGIGGTCWWFYLRK